MSLRVMMIPAPDNMRGHAESGIRRVAEFYARTLPAFDIELVNEHAVSFDVLAVHAGMSNKFDVGGPLVAHIHGLYWQGDYDTAYWQEKANRDVIASIRHATEVTVPSEWVAECFRRDMHFSPVVIPHGVDWDEWQQDAEDGGYVLWNKNRNTDACDPRPVIELAQRFPEVRFLTTFAPEDSPPNVKAVGVVPHEQMKEMILRATVYLATTKETWGVGTVECMAAGRPILGFDHGGTAQLCRHGVNGYLARPGDYHELAEGLRYVLAHKRTLGENSRALAKEYTWDRAAGMVAATYRGAMEKYHTPHEVGVVIPCYNKFATLGRAVYSVLAQTVPAARIVIVNNNSSDNSWGLAKQLEAENPGKITVINEDRQGVAHARNAGIALLDTRYICCLDADDEMEPGFLEVCVKTLKADPSIGLAYTKLLAVNTDGKGVVSAWPGEYNYDRFLAGQNQVPTCCVFRQELWTRLGGYRQRYAPHGAGAEDAEFWLRMGASGYRGKLATGEALFRYHLGGAVSGDSNYREVNWRGWHPWVADGRHPFASVATPSNALSHPVRAYDDPAITVVIPCAEYHKYTIVDALDSLEAQTFRRWEVIVTCDGFAPGKTLRDAYPYARFLTFHEKVGAGAARNAGVEEAKAPYLFFLDADDWLTPEALSTLYNATSIYPSHILYGDYVGHAILEPRERERLRAVGRLVSYDEKTNESVIQYSAMEYDCEKAAIQPSIAADGSFYIWNLVSSLVPKVWHDEMGGFDEQMPSWEDWDYWLRLSWRGKCFARIPKILVEYRFGTGQRRALANPGESGDSGRQLSQRLLQYLLEKRRRESIMPCGGCKKHTPVNSPAPAQVLQPFSNTRMESMANVSASDVVWVELVDGNIGDHPISFSGTFYGYRSHGDRFKMPRAHAVVYRAVRIVDDADMIPQDAPQAPRQAPQAPTPIVQNFNVVVQAEKPAEEKTIVLQPEVFDFTKIWGINEERARQLVEMGYRTIEGFLSVPEERLTEELGISAHQVSRVFQSARKLADKTPV